MADVHRTVAAISAAEWNERVALIRRIPEDFGTAHLQEVYSETARQVYVPHLAPDFAFIPWRPDYELERFTAAYDRAHSLTNGFQDVSVADLERILMEAPETLRIFRVLLGFTGQELAAASALVAAELEVSEVGRGRIKSMEEGRKPPESAAQLTAQVVDRAMSGGMGESPSDEVRAKIDKPDTKQGWETVRGYAAQGVPFAMFLHQRHYGGAFRQLLDATSTARGDILEDAVQSLFEEKSIPFVRTGSHNQAEIESRFGLTVRPAPDFVVYDSKGTLRAILECKGANDGGTARDKAARFRSLRQESMRLGGVPTVAVLSGLGWTRTTDALGPVVRDTDGRTFTLANIREMLHVEPFFSLKV